jgi:hypothetical protein
MTSHSLIDYYAIKIGEWQYLFATFEANEKYTYYSITSCTIQVFWACLAQQVLMKMTSLSGNVLYLLNYLSENRRQTYLYIRIASFCLWTD